MRPAGWHSGVCHPAPPFPEVGRPGIMLHGPEQANVRADMGGHARTCAPMRLNEATDLASSCGF